MAKTSAGLLMYRMKRRKLQVLLAHPGGPFFKNKDKDTWTIPKGEPDPGEDLFAAALREFAEETGLTPQPPFIPLQPIQQKGGKVVHAWAFAGDCDPTTLQSNIITIEWPLRSGREIQIPEIDRADFFDLDVARKKIKAAQAALIDELEAILESK
jgi:predicted NUDIX family NTP pyrophosphohydrolase